MFIVEIMGHKVGWLTLHAGIAGGADIILLPEIPYDLKKVVAKIEERTKSGSRFSIPVSYTHLVHGHEVSPEEMERILAERKSRW